MGYILSQNLKTKHYFFELFVYGNVNQKQFKTIQLS